MLIISAMRKRFGSLHVRDEAIIACLLLYH